MPNRLAESSSPYLRQHQHNPVDWYPWCPEAFSKAKQEDKPIFLSVGYSACHWCHVMEHESFENEQIAATLNEHFVSIKVDREERPDVDQIYMQAVQMLAGNGGWPMSVFMAADGRPFFAGTYWPPDNRWGRPGFGQVLLAVVDAWKHKRPQIAEQGEQISQHLQTICRGPEAAPGGLDRQWISAAAAWLVSNHDARYGGFGSAPKFPHAMDLALLIDLSVSEADQRGDADNAKTESTSVSVQREAAVAVTLDQMARGGIYDHLGGGFARYSVDDKWLVPHFEKMLYDNALLAGVYASAYRRWQRPEYAQVVRDTLDYVIRDMTNDGGGYHSTEDADSEGVEGKFYVWTPAEINELLGPVRGEQFCDCYDVTPAGNFEGQNILHLRRPLPELAAEHRLSPAELEQQLAEDRRQLLARRNQRIRPGLDDKVLLSWNALMIDAMVQGYRALGEPRYLASAQRAVRFLIDHLRRDDGRWHHSWRDGRAMLGAYLDDTSYLVQALVELFQVDSRLEYLQLAIEAAEQLLADYRDEAEGGFFFTAHDQEALIARGKDVADSSVPSGNAMAATGLLTLARLTGREDFRSAADEALRTCSGVMSRSPQAAGQALRTLLRQSRRQSELVLVGLPDAAEFAEARRRLLARFDPTAICVCLSEPADEGSQLAQLCPLLHGRTAAAAAPTLYVCEGGHCQLPLVGEAALDLLAQHATNDDD